MANTPPYIELQITPEHAAKVLKALASNASGYTTQPQQGIKGISALEVLKKERARCSIVTFCAEVDEMFGGGVPIGEVTEFCGVPGIGKTQIG